MGAVQQGGRGGEQAADVSWAGHGRGPASTFDQAEGPVLQKKSAVKTNSLRRNERRRDRKVLIAVEWLPDEGHTISTTNDKAFGFGTPVHGVMGLRPETNNSKYSCFCK